MIRRIVPLSCPNHFNNETIQFLVGKQELLEKELNALVPEKFVLGNNYPNPLNAGTIIPVEIPVSSEVSLLVYDLLGKKVRTIHSGILEPGRHWLKWDRRDDKDYKTWAQEITTDGQQRVVADLESGGGGKKWSWFVGGLAVAGGGLAYLLAVSPDSNPVSKWPKPPVRP